jgi:hypothetical protein
MTDTQARARVWTLCLAALALAALTGPRVGLLTLLAHASAPALTLMVAVLAVAVLHVVRPRSTDQWSPNGGTRGRSSAWRDTARSRGPTRRDTGGQEAQIPGPMGGPRGRCRGSTAPPSVGLLGGLGPHPWVHDKPLFSV